MSRFVGTLASEAEGDFSHYANRSPSEPPHFREGLSRFAAVSGTAEASFSHDPEKPE
jgi:hypothetical protein